MSSPSYNVVTVDLSVANNELRQETNQPVESITVLQIDSAVVIRLGSGPQFQPLLGQTIDICPALTDGIFVTNVAGAGVLSLLVNYGQLKVSTNA